MEIAQKLPWRTAFRRAALSVSTYIGYAGAILVGVVLSIGSENGLDVLVLFSTLPLIYLGSVIMHRYWNRPVTLIQPRAGMFLITNTATNCWRALKIFFAIFAVFMIAVSVGTGLLLGYFDWPALQKLLLKGSQDQLHSMIGTWFSVALVATVLYVPFVIIRKWGPTGYVLSTRQLDNGDREFYLRHLTDDQVECSAQNAVI